MAEEKMQLEDWLDDLCVRFIINLPEEDLSSVARICFQIEEAQWFYEDFVRPLDPTLPSMTLRSFSLRIFQHCPLLAPFSVENHTKAFEEFLQYKTRVPVRGAILLNEAMDSTILVKGWKKGANWSFPRGKINKDEDDLECAIREVYEETGYDLHAAGLVPENRDGVKYIEVTMREQQLRLYVFRNVPMDTYFQPRTRKEISKIQWYKLSELPAFRKKGNQPPNDATVAANANKFYMVAPFLVPLKKWVVQQKKMDAAKATQQAQFNTHSLHEEPVTEDDVWQTEAATDISNRTPGIDTLEGATQELQRLLKVQPTAAQATSKPTSPDVNPDKGASLLAILQANNQAASPRVPNPILPHTPLDHIIREPPQPQSPRGQHHPQQRAPLAAYQSPPAFPTVPDGTWQSWASHQPEKPAAVSPEIRHHDLSMMASPAYTPQPPSRHSQSVPQVQQNVLGTVGFTEPNPPPPPKHAQGTINQCTPNAQFLQTHFQQQGQHPMYQIKPPSGQLSDHSMALLGVLKSDTKATGLDSAYHVSPQQLESTPPRQDQPFSGIHGHGGSQMDAQPPNLPFLDASAPQRQQNIGMMPRFQHPSNSTQRSTLLQMFNKPATSSPLANQLAEPSKNPSSADFMKGISTDKAPSHNTLGTVVQNRGAEPVSSSLFSRPPQGVSDITSQVPIQSLSIQIGAARQENQNTQTMMEYVSKTADNRAPYHQGTDTYHKQSPHMYYNQTLEPADNFGKPGGLRTPTLSSVFGADKPASLASPPAASALPAPGIFQQKPQMSTEQRHKLLSLFGKPQSPSHWPGPGLDDKVKGRELTAVDVAMRSRVTSLAPVSEQGASEGQSEHRRGSQTPISPADRSFLLGYLASVANNAK